MRGGYCELVNVDPGIQAQLFKLVSAKLCPTVTGQVITKNSKCFLYDYEQHCTVGVGIKPLVVVAMYKDEKFRFKIMLSNVTYCTCT